MNPQADFLIRHFREHAETVACSTFNKTQHLITLDDARAIALLALTEAATRWHDYCRGRGYDPGADYFWAYALRCIKGALVDEFRRCIPLSRTRPGAYRAPVSLDEILETTPETITASNDTNPEHTTATLTTEITTTLINTLRDMPPETQTIVALHHRHGIQLNTIAELLGIGPYRAYRLHREAVLHLLDTITTHLETSHAQ